MIRLANLNELDRIMEIINDGKSALRGMKIPQWRGEYPDVNTIKKDIEAHEFYVFEQGGEIVSVMSLVTDHDPSYDTLTGEWRTNSYTAVHRLAVDKEHMGCGYASRLLDFAIEKSCEMGYESIRIDTHKENIPVIKLANKYGFEYSGTITFESGDSGVAYEKMLDRNYGIYLRTFDQLNSEDVYSILRLRQNVFIVEQESIFEDIDGLDFACLHMMAYERGELIGYIRILPAGLSFDEPSMGRYCVSKNARGRGVGRVLFTKSINYIHNEMLEPVIRINAQSYLAEPYKRAGFNVVGEEYILDGIPHIEMIKYDKNK